jgi:hypothetical protein
MGFCNHWICIYWSFGVLYNNNIMSSYTLKNNWQVLLSIWQFLKSTRKLSFWLDIQSIWKVTYRFQKYIVDFLAYFHTLLSALFRPSVTASSLRGIDRSCPFMAQSIAYDPRTWTKEGIFFGPVLGPVGGVRSSNPFVFSYINFNKAPVKGSCVIE